jgi:hypothetical protein
MMLEVFSLINPALAKIFALPSCMANSSVKKYAVHRWRKKKTQWMCSAYLSLAPKSHYVLVRQHVIDIHRRSGSWGRKGEAGTDGHGRWIRRLASWKLEPQALEEKKSTVHGNGNLPILFVHAMDNVHTSAKTSKTLGSSPRRWRQ